MTDNNSSGLAQRLNLPTLIATFAKAEADIRGAFAVVVEAERSLNDTFTLGEQRRRLRVDVSHCGSQGDGFDRPDQTIMRLRASAWATIAERLELARVMSIADAKALDKWLAEGDPPLGTDRYGDRRWPDITVENVRAFGEKYSDPRSSFERAVVEVFNWLRPSRRSDFGAGKYKTNNLLEIDERVIITGCVHASYSGGGCEVDYDDRANLLALERVLLVLDGQGMRNKGHVSELEQAIEASGKAAKGETEYFAFRAFKGERTLHLRFKRKDLLAQINRIAGAGLLKPNAAA